MRRGSSTSTSPPSASSAGGTRVVFPAPGAASITRFGVRPQSAPRSRAAMIERQMAKHSLTSVRAVILFGRTAMQSHAASCFQAAALSPLAAALGQNKKLPVGLELYSVRKALQEDLMGTVRKVAAMGYRTWNSSRPITTGPRAGQRRPQADGRSGHEVPLHAQNLRELQAREYAEDNRLQQDPGDADMW